MHSGIPAEDDLHAFIHNDAAWLAQNYETARPVIVATGFVAALVLAVVVVHVNRRAYRCIEEIEDA